MGDGLKVIGDGGKVIGEREPKTLHLAPCT